MWSTNPTIQQKLIAGKDQTNRDMIRYSGTYKIGILKKDIKEWDSNEYVFVVKTNDLKSAKDIEQSVQIT